MSDKIRKYVLPNLPYLFVFWFFSKIGTAYRIAPGTDFGTKLMGMLDTFPKAFETYWPGLGGIDLLVGLAGAAGVYLLIQSKIRQAKKFRRDAEYGTARFGTKEDKLMGPYFISKKNLPEGEMVDPAVFTRIFKNKVIMYLFDDAAKQKRITLFGGCDEKAKNQYSKICREFDTKGVYIFCEGISSQFIDNVPEDDGE